MAAENADTTSFPDRFHRTATVCNGQTLTRHQAGLIDVGLFSEELKAEAKTRQEKLDRGWFDGEPRLIS